ncbi:MAG: AmpG family muropeptide MFS transporter, partial [Alphaproteobacteria bacterium]|nr:AmpG family muropeptide MFS transporter [Alphaproteobacteria bacterium]
MQSSQGDPSTGAVSSWASALAGFTEKRVLAVLALGFSSGLPLALTFGTLSIWLAEEGVSRTAIGLFASVGTPYALKFLWAPVIDRVDFPLLGRFFGRRRGWMLATQFASAAAILALGQTHPGEDAWLTALLALIVATCSASQDIVIDAYRVEILERRLLPSGATAVQFGYRIAMLVSGAGALYLATFVGWSTTYAVMAGLLLVGVIATLANPEPEQSPATSAVPEGAVAWLRRAVLDPFADFLRRPGWLAILAFIVLYKFGDAFAGVMTSPFLIDIGFSKIEIANVVKVFGFGATMAGLVLGGVLMNAVGLVRSLWICGLLQLGSNLVFCLQAAV